MRKGYGRYGISIDGKVRNLYVHRVAAWLWLGFDMGSDLLVMHRCDNPPCFNPAHLFAGTVADNQADMAAKGRGRNGGLRGEQLTQSKLTEADIRAMRDQWPGATADELGARFGVSRVQVYNIVNRKHWRHVQ